MDKARKAARKQNDVTPNAEVQSSSAAAETQNTYDPRQVILTEKMTSQIEDAAALAAANSIATATAAAAETAAAAAVELASVKQQSAAAQGAFQASLAEAQAKQNQQIAAQEELQGKLTLQQADSLQLLNMIKAQQTAIDNINTQMAQMAQENITLRATINTQAATTEGMRVQLAEIHAMFTANKPAAPPAQQQQQMQQQQQQQQQPQQPQQQQQTTQHPSEKRERSPKREDAAAAAATAAAAAAAAAGSDQAYESCSEDEKSEYTKVTGRKKGKADRADTTATH
jgi:hypothetical protein